MLSKKVCETCGKEFEIKQKGKPNRYCSILCYRQAWKNGKYRYVNIMKIKNRFTCSYCGKEVIGSKSKKRNGESSEYIFCNRECYDKYRRLNSDKRCLHCGKHFVAIGVKKKAQFCDDICRRAYFAQKSYIICAVCGQVFYPWSFDKSRDSVIMSKEVKTCSKKCRKIYAERQEAIRRNKISIAFTGEKHPNWHGGILAYRGHNWHRQRRLALIRDEYKCQICGLTNKENLRRWKASLEVHHKIPYLFFDGDYKRANDLSNLITLYQNCHTEVEWKYKREHRNEYKEHTAYQKKLQGIRYRSRERSQLYCE